MKYWKDLLAPYPGEAIKFAFDKHLREGDGFFPTPDKILTPLNAFMAEQRKQREMAEREREQAQRRAARERGETFGITDVVKIMQDKVAEIRERKLDEKREELRRVIPRDELTEQKANQVLLGYQFLQQLKEGLGDHEQR